MADPIESNEMEGGNESAGGGGDLQRKANRIIAFFSQIAECLEETEMTDMNEILLGVFEESKQKDSAETRERLMQLYSRFFEVVEFRSGISVKLIDQALRSFKMIAIDAVSLGNLVSEKYMEMILLEYPSLGIDMQLTPELLRTYFSLLKEGSEEICHIRLMVVGMYEVGKSTLVRRLCNQPFRNVKTTEGIDILTNSCEINDDGEWEISKKDEKDRFFRERLQVMVNKVGKREKTSTGGSSGLPTVESKTETVPLPPQVESHDKEEEERFAHHVIEKNRKKEDNSIVADLIKFGKESKILERKPTVSIWDFAGQSVYYSTHHFFLNARSIYLVVLDLSKKLTDEVEEKDTDGYQENLMRGKTAEYPTCHDAFKFWMRSIYIYTEQKKKEHNPKYKPTIILIGTHKDMITSDILGRKTLDRYKEDYFNEALGCFKGKPIMHLIHPKKFFVGMDDAKEAFLEIKREIYNIASKTTFWREKVPASFLRLEKTVNEKKNQEEHFMYFESLEKADDGLKLPNFEPEDIKLFLKFQNAFGNVLYYNHDQLDKMIILNPQWIIDVFKIFITHKKDKNPTHLEKWTNFESYGTLENALIDDILKGKDLSDAKDAVQYMECLNVMVRPVVVNEERASDCQSQDSAGLFFQQYGCSKKKVTDFYIMPCMLSQRPEDDELKKLFAGFRKNQELPTLCMYIKKGFLPPFVFHCIIATCIKELPISKRSNQQLLFRGLGEFMLESTTRLLIWFVDDFLHFTVIFEDKNETCKKKMEYCRDVRTCFEKLVLNVFNIHGKDTFDDSNKLELFEYLVKCPKCPQLVPFQEAGRSVSYKDHFISVTDIESSTKEICSTCNKMVTMKEALRFWFHTERQQSHSVTCSHEAHLEDTLADDMLADLAEHIGDKISELTDELGIDSSQTFCIKKDFPACQKTRAYKVLHHWKTKEKNLPKLRSAMENCGFNLDLFDRIVAREEEDVTEEAIISCMEGLDEAKFQDETLWGNVVPKLVKCIGKNYWLIGIRLNIEDIELEQRVGDDQTEQIKNILDTWWKDHTGFDVLIKAMVKSGCDMQKVKHVLMQFYSS